MRKHFVHTQTVFLDAAATFLGQFLWGSGRRRASTASQRGRPSRCLPNAWQVAGRTPQPHQRQNVAVFADLLQRCWAHVLADFAADLLHCHFWSKPGVGCALGLRYLSFPETRDGFWANWVFNFVAHPVANYIVARGVIGWFARQILWDLESRSSLCKTERSRIKQQIGKVLNLAPIADSLWCVSEHFLFSLASIYPIPFSVPLSCIPGAFLSMGVFYRLLSKEVRVLQSTAKFFRFTFCTLSGFCLLYAGMVFYTAFFGQVEMGMQLVMSFSVSAVEFLMGKVIQKLGNWWNVPIHIVRELATCMKLPVIIFKASILSEVKGLWVFLSMVLPEVLQVGCSVMMVLFDLLSSNTQIQEAFATVRSRQQFVQACCISYYEFKCVQQRLKHIVQSCKTTSKKDLERMAWTWRNDHDLLNEISSSLTATVMLEVCEVMAPVIYIGLLLCLRSNTFLANNASYFLGLANANFQESLIANSFSLLLEASLLLVTELCVRAVIGMSFCSFIGSVLRCDFRFWLSTLSMAYIAWLTMVVQHTGHDLKFQFSWLPWGRNGLRWAKYLVRLAYSHILPIWDEYGWMKINV